MSDSRVNVLTQLRHLVPLGVPEFDTLPTPSAAPAMAMSKGVLHFFVMFPETEAPAWYTFTEVAVNNQAFSDLIAQLITTNVRDQLNTALSELDLTMTQEEFMGYMANATSVGGIDLNDILTVNDIIDCGELT